VYNNNQGILQNILLCPDKNSLQLYLEERRKNDDGNHFLDWDIAKIDWIEHL
jgi:hypothetical protein